MKSLKSGWPRLMQQLKIIAECSSSCITKVIDNHFKIVTSTDCITGEIREGHIFKSHEYGLNNLLSENPKPHTSFVNDNNSKFQTFLTVPIIVENNILWGALILLREEKVLFDYESEKDVLVIAQLIADQISFHQSKEINNKDLNPPLKEQVIAYFFDEMHVVPWQLDYKTEKIKYLGNQGKKIFGFDKQDWKNIDDWKKCIHPEDREKTKKILQKNCNQKENHVLEYRIIKKDKQVIWVRNMVKVIQDKNHQNIKLVGLMMDITHFKQNEQNLQALNNQLKYILNATNTILSIIDDNNKVIFHSHEDINKIKLKCYEHFANRKGKCTDCPLRNIERTNRIFYDKIKQKTYQVTAFPFEAHQNVWHIAEVRIDITNRIEQENKIISLKNILEFNMEAGNIGYFEYDLKENKLKSNKVFDTITGYNFNGENIQFDWLLSRFHPNETHKIINYFSQTTKGQKLDFECRILHANNHYIWINYSGQIISHDNSEGKPTIITGIIKDITSSKQLLQDLVFERNNSLKASEAKSTFLANMSHEIRTPMNAIIGFTELLGKHVTDPPYNNFLNSIKTSGKVLLSLINDLLDFEKIEAGKMQINKDWVSFNQLVIEIKNTFSVLAIEKQIKLLIEPDDNFPENIYIDSLKINQILLNLVNNALKFTNKGSITIKYSFSIYENDKEGILTFSVCDTGIGVPEDKRKHIFEPFVQGRESSQINQQGTGLGLSIVQKIVHLMGGNIGLTSEINKGSVFSILIPDVQYSRISSKNDNRKDLYLKTLSTHDEHTVITQDITAELKLTENKTLLKYSDITPDNHEFIKNKFNNKLIPVWLDLKELLSSEDINTFKQELNELEKKINWTDLSIYNQKLETAIKSYDYEDIQKLITNFNTFIHLVNPEFLT